MRSNLDTKKELIIYLKQFRWWLRLEIFLILTFYFSGFFLILSLIIWLINVSSISYGYNILQSSFHIIFFVILILIPLTIITILFYKEIIKYFSRKTRWSTLAETYERRKYFSGELISSADFLECSYNHHKDLENIFIEKTYTKISKIPVHSLFQTKFLIKPSIILGTSVLVLLICSAIFSYTPIDTIKASFIGESVDITYKIDYQKRVLIGQNFYLEIITNAENTVLYIKQDNKELIIPLNKRLFDSNPISYSYQYKYFKVDKPFSFYLKLNKKGSWITTPVHEVLISYHPIIKSIKATLQSPHVYNLPVKQQDDGNIEGFYDSKVKIEIECNNKLQEAKIKFLKDNIDDIQVFNKKHIGNKVITTSKKPHERNNFNIIDMKITNNKAITEFNITETMNYTIIVKDNIGNYNAERSFFIHLLKDYPPNVNIITPEKNLTLKHLIDQQITIEASDDYQVKHIILYYYITDNKGRKTNIKSINLKTLSDQAVQVNGIIPLSKLKLKYGDSVEYFAKAMDNGGQWGESSPHKFILSEVTELASESQLFKNIEAKKSDLLKKVENILNQFKELNKESIKAYADKQSDKLTGKQLEKKLAELSKKQKELEEKIRESIREMENFEAELSVQKKIPAKELKDKIRDIKKLMSNLLKETKEIENNSLKNRLKKIIEKANKLNNLKNQLKNKSPNTEKPTEQPLNNNKSHKQKLDDINKLKKDLKQQIKKALKDIKKSKSKVAKDEDPSKIKDKLKEIKKLLSELLNEQNKKNLDELQKLLAKTPSDNMEWDKERFINRLEKTIEQLKKLKELQNLLEAKNKAHKLIKQQSTLNTKIKKSTNTKPLEKDAKNIEKNVNELFNKLKPKNSSALAQLQNQDKKDINESVNKELQNMKNSLANNQKSESLKSGENLENQFSNLEKEIQNKIQQFMEKEKRDIVAYLRNLLFELIELRKMEGKKSQIIDEGKINPNFSQEYLTKLIEVTNFSKKFLMREQSNFNKNLEGSMKHKDKTEFIKLFNYIINKLSISRENISSKDFYYANYNQKEVLSKLNHLSLMLMKLKFKAQQGLGGQQTQNQMSNTIEDLAKFQSQINQDMQNLMEKMKNGKLSKEEEKTLKKLAKRQGDIGKEIDKILNSKNVGGKDPIEKLLGDLAEIKREIDEIKLKMTNKKLDKKLLNKQKDVYKRLSNATKSLKDDTEGDDNDKNLENDNRKADKPTLLFKEKNLLDAKKRLRKALNNQQLNKLKNSKNLNSKQKEMIKNYFKSLQDFSKK
ncbi:MAG: hypothetical protein OEV44_01740 [Spirochaetota bacterium]|nr:hypothetical protein [Spirochaetota bacterium]